jgi:hypothetical protein
MIIGVVCGVVGVILLGLLVAYCWSQVSKEGDVGGGMAGQDANAIDYSQQYPGPHEVGQEMVNSHVATLRNSRGSTGGEGPYMGPSFDNRGSHGGRGPGRLSYDGDESGRPQPRHVAYLQPQVTFDQPAEHYYGEQRLPPTHLNEAYRSHPEHMYRVDRMQR